MNRETRLLPAMMALLLLSVAMLPLSGCTEPDTYPITGAECGPDDPVKTIGNCISPV